MPYVTTVERAGIEKGMQLGLQQGEQQGLQRGLLQGEATVLARQLARRFGPLSQAILDRLSEASQEELECWAERILDAPSIEEVFRNLGSGLET